ncbi:DMT family transporter [Anaerobacillus alkaliphilus]|uniref:DMT family transporter n=1 Tax=Anaerobacillus alkaliphilus TaxID=1548597 RepID=A0A4Q0VXM3_9BACI|nr:DMT family transporter [Anaerobacillus alkaliphilus]RXJ02454.1 DMT family transporter [Anaerobacillus alkaliphilus]
MRLFGPLLVLSLIWGLSFVFIENLIGTAGVWGTVFLRCLAGAIILLPILLIKFKRKEVPKRLPWKALVTVGVFNAALPWGLIALSQTNITSNTAAVLNALTPILTGLNGFIIFSVFLNKRQWIGIILGFVGILILMEFNINELFSSNFIGIGTMVLATTCYGFASHFTRRHLQGLNVVIITTFSLLVGACIGAIGVVVTDSSSFANIINSIDLVFLVSVIGLGCLGSGIAHLLYYYLINHGGAEFASTVTYLIPLTALMWGNVLLGEPITSNLIIGLITIFLGVFLANQKSRVIVQTTIKSQ